MVPLTITCVSCGQTWTVAHTFSIYEQQAVESCPCPHCGAYTLCCQPAEGRRWAAIDREQVPALSATHH